MTRKDYVSAAKTFADMLHYCTPDGRGDIRAEAIAECAKGMADLFARDNSRFDRQRFYFAAGLSENGRPLEYPSGDERPYPARPITG